MARPQRGPNDRSREQVETPPVEAFTESAPAPEAPAETNEEADEAEEIENG